MKSMQVSTSNYYVRNFISILEEHDVDTTPLLRECGIQQSMLQRENSLLPFEKYIRLIDLSIAATNIPALGIKAGVNVPIAPYDSLSYLALIAPNLGEAIKRFCRFGPKPRSIMKATFEVSGDEASINIKVLPNLQISKVVQRYLLMEIAAILSRLSDLLGLDHKWLTRVEMPFSADGEQDVVSEQLESPVVWNSDSLRLVFPAKYVSFPINADKLVMDPVVKQQYNFFKQQYQHLTQDLCKGASITAEISRLMTLGGSNPLTIEDMAKLFGINKRTLQRKLDDEGTSYREIVLSTRMMFAKFYLDNTTLPASEIGYLLGYGEHVNFYRAFKTYYGKPPGDMRKQIKD